MALTQGRVLSFLLDHGGKVKNSELLNNFKEFINCSDPLVKGRNRDVFKSFVNSVAVVKQIDDEKYVVVKKKYKQLVQGERNSLEAELEHSLARLNSSQASSDASEQSGYSTSESDTIHTADVLNTNSNVWTSLNSVYCISNSESLIAKPEFQVDSYAECDPGIQPPSATPRSRQEDFVTVLNVSNNTRVAKKGAVFAVVALKSPPPPHSQHGNSCRSRVKSHHKPRSEDLAPEQHVTSLESLSQQARADRPAAAGNTSSYPSPVTDGHDLLGPPRTQQRPGSPAPQRVNKVPKPGQDGMQSSAFPLEPREHEWLMRSAEGHWGQIYQLLLQDVQLAGKRNFMSGFTTLHWAAKKGNIEMVSKILLMSCCGGRGVDVNAKSHDGYTPLHVAAIHGHEAVLRVLVCDYGADCNIRDNSGKKPHHYLCQDVSAKVRELLGDSHAPPWAGGHTRGHVRSRHDQCSPQAPTGLSTLRKLFESRQRKNVRRRPNCHVVVGPDQDEDRKGCTLKPRMLPCH